MPAKPKKSKAKSAKQKQAEKAAESGVRSAQKTLSKFIGST